MKEDTVIFKKKLEEEKKKIEEDLEGISRKNPKDPNDFQAIMPEDPDERDADPNELADNIEDYEENFALNDVLEKRLNEVKAALKRIDDGTYGVCKFGGSGHPIEKELLDANATATTCIKHLEV